MSTTEANTLFPESAFLTPSLTRAKKRKPHQLSRDEMNLAEFPLSVLSTRLSPTTKTLEFQDSVKGKNGEVVTRNWIITGADKFGLPTASDEEVLLGLVKLSVDEGIQNRKVHFTRYELLKILRWTTEGRSYQRLQKALDRLTGVRIKATNAFYDNELKQHQTKQFGILDAYEINSSRGDDLPTSYFVWSETIFNSFQAGFIKKLDFDFYLSLNSAVSRRLYRYLDKHFWYRSKIEVNLFTLAHEKLGVSRNYKYPSSLRQQIEPALEELTERSFLKEFSFTGRGQATSLTLIASSAPKNQSNNQEFMKEEVVPSSSLKTQTILKLTERGLSEAQALRLVSHKSEEVLRRVQEIIIYFDHLVAKKSPLISNPVGFLYRAVESPLKFNLPSDPRPTQEQVPIHQFSQEPLALAVPPTKSRKKKDSLDLEARYLIEKKELIEQHLLTTPGKELQALRFQVEQALSKLQDHISSERMEQAIDHAVREKLAKKIGIPDFSSWKKMKEEQDNS